MKKSIAIGLALALICGAVPLALAAPWVDVEGTEALAAALADPQVTQIRLLSDIELPEGGLVVNGEKESLTLDGAGHSLTAWDAGLIFDAPSTRGREISLFDIDLFSEGDTALLRTQGEGKALAFSLRDVRFDGDVLIDASAASLTLQNVQMDVYATVGSARNFKFIGENGITRYAGSANTAYLLTVSGSEQKNGEGSWILDPGAVLSVQDNAEESRGFINSTYPNALMTIGASARLSFQGCGSLLTGLPFQVVRLEENAWVEAEVWGNLDDAMISVNDTLLVGRGATMRLLAGENERPVPIILVREGGKVSFGNVSEVLLYNGCQTGGERNLTLAYEDKNGLWLNRTQLVELFGAGSAATAGDLGMPDFQWRNGPGGVFQMDATMRSDGTVAGLIMKDYSGSIELNKETLSLVGIRALRVGDVALPEQLLAPAETPKPIVYARDKPQETPEPQWWENGGNAGGVVIDSQGNVSPGGDYDAAWDADDWNWDNYVPPVEGADGSID